MLCALFKFVYFYFDIAPHGKTECDYSTDTSHAIMQSECRYADGSSTIRNAFTFHNVHHIYFWIFTSFVSIGLIPDIYETIFRNQLILFSDYDLYKTWSPWVEDWYNRIYECKKKWWTCYYLMERTIYKLNLKFLLFRTKYFDFSWWWTYWRSIFCLIKII